MPKQLLIYETAVPVSATRHADASIEASDRYAFSAGVSAVPLMAVEFPRAAAEYAIVFTADGEESVMPVVVLGVRREQNLYLSSGDQWNAKYVPAFIRRYPFVFSASADRKTLTLCIDESHPGFNREGRGSRLFGDDAKPTPFVDRVLTFLKEFQGHLERTRLFGRRLKELQLLQPMQASVTTPTGEKITMGTFLAVSREKLRALDGETLEKLARNDELELLYLHLASMGNFNEVKERFIGAGADKGAPIADTAPAEAAAAAADPGGEEKAGSGRQRSGGKAPAEG